MEKAQQIHRYCAIRGMDTWLSELKSLCFGCFFFIYIFIFWCVGKVGRCMLHSLKSPPFKGFENESFHLRKLQMRTDWVADEPVNYLERLFVRQRLQKCSAFQVSVFIRWNKALSVRNKLTLWQWCTRCLLITSPIWSLPLCLTLKIGEAVGWFSDITQHNGFQYMHKQC